MGFASPKEVTRLLAQWSDGNEAARTDLMAAIYDDLRRLAARYMSHERPGHTLQTTGLVHEAYLRLVDQQHVRWQNRAHFFGIAAQLMRRILVDYARNRDCVKRGGSVSKLSNPDDQVGASDASHDVDVIALDQTLTRLAAKNARHARIVELKFFGGLTVPEIADVLRVSDRTVKREWHLAKAWLYRELQSETSRG